MSNRMREHVAYQAGTDRHSHHFPPLACLASELILNRSGYNLFILRYFLRVTRPMTASPFQDAPAAAWRRRGAVAGSKDAWTCEQSL